MGGRSFAGSQRVFRRRHERVGAHPLHALKRLLRELTRLPRLHRWWQTITKNNSNTTKKVQTQHSVFQAPLLHISRTCSLVLPVLTGLLLEDFEPPPA